MTLQAVGRGTRDRPDLAAVRSRLALIALLYALAAVGWWRTLDQMRGMDGGPWTGLGPLSWFLGVWVVMMAAMMLPSVAPTVALYSKMTRRRAPLLPLLFAAGYLLSWAGAGVVAVALGRVISTVGGDALTWTRLGRVLAGSTLVVAALYELTPFKDACLGRCRSPLGLLLGSWRDGPAGAVQMGARAGAWCLGCCWALMVSLFALGVMSVVWMAVIAGVVTAEKVLPWGRATTYAAALVLAALGVLLLAAPDLVPGLTTPMGHSTMT